MLGRHLKRKAMNRINVVGTSGSGKSIFIRSITKAELWYDTGNVETFRKSFFSRDSVIIWTLKTYQRNRVRYTEMFNDPKYRHIKFVRLKSPKMAKKFIDELDL